MKLYRKIINGMIKKEIFPGICLMEFLIQLIIVLLILFIIIAR